MSTINNLSGINSNYATQSTQKTNETSGDQQETKVHHKHHHHKKVQDSTEVSQEGQALNNAQNIMNGLVSSGTLSQDQASAVQSAVAGAMQSGSTSNPLSALIKNGTITQEQALSINDAFVQSRQSENK